MTLITETVILRMWLNHVLLCFAWMIYCVLHSVLAALSFKKQMRAWLGDGFRYYRIFYTLFAFAGLILLIWWMFKMQSPLLFEVQELIYIPGVLLAVFGLTIMLICIRKYFFSLSGLKSLFYEGPTNQLIISGIHKYVRHPLYLGTFIFIWGLFFVFPYLSVFITNLVITIYTLAAISLEEEKLIQEYGEAYERYRREVPKLVPGIKKKSRLQGK